MIKGFSTVRDTWRGMQSYMERRRGRREIDVTRRIKEKRIKRNEDNLRDLLDNVKHPNI